MLPYWAKCPVESWYTRFPARHPDRYNKAYMKAEADEREAQRQRRLEEWRRRLDEKYERELAQQRAALRAKKAAWRAIHPRGEKGRFVARKDVQPG
jgi:hypothetical protein